MKTFYDTSQKTLPAKSTPPPNPHTLRSVNGHSLTSYRPNNVFRFHHQH